MGDVDRLVAFLLGILYKFGFMKSAIFAFVRKITILKSCLIIFSI